MKTLLIPALCAAILGGLLWFMPQIAEARFAVRLIAYRLAAVETIASDTAPLPVEEHDDELDLDGTTVTLTNCLANGTTTASITPGEYMMTAFDERLSVCEATACAAGGVDLNAGTAPIPVTIAGTDVACRSATPTGDVQFVARQ